MTETRIEPSPEEIEAQKKKQQEEFDKLPKTIGKVEMGRPGFVIDPKTGAKKPSGKLPGNGGDIE